MPRNSRRREPNPRTKRAVSRWTARLIPPLLLGAVGYCTYVIVSPLSVHYLLRRHHETGAAVAILVVYFVLLALWLTTFTRLWLLITFAPPYLPLGEDAPVKQKIPLGRRRGDEIQLGDGGYEQYISYEASEKRHNDPDAPGLERFYTKDVFVSELDGRPRWCRQCANWKPDRTHHCSDVGRCIYKMDHFCPWVGGPVGENNFKFFIQFMGYTALTCTHLLVVMAIYVAKQLSRRGESYNGNFVAVIILAGFFGMFTTSMCITSSRMACQNQTQIESLDAKTKVYVLAIHKPAQVSIQVPPNPTYHEVSYPLPVIGGSPPQAQPGHDREASPIEPRATEARETAAAPPPDDHLDPNILYQKERPQDPVIDARDARATRTFAVLLTQPGDNPWDLGSYQRNWQTVMGHNLLDWILPIKRSPCCTHDPGAQAQFQYGPAVENLKVAAGFIPPVQRSAKSRSTLFGSLFRRGSLSIREDGVGKAVEMETSRKVYSCLGS